MGRAPGNKGHKGSRAKNGSSGYYKGRYYISFYKEEDGDEEFYTGFNNVVEICKYLKWEITTININKIHQVLYKALYEKDDPYTKLIDGVKLKVYLIDMIDEIKENERREKEMKKFVKINSTITIEVYPDLSAIDTTNAAAPMADRLSAKPNWVYPILITTGVHYYPSEIKAWNTVKSLAKKNFLTISEEVDEVPEAEKAKCEEMRKKMAKVSARPSTKKSEPKKEVVKEEQVAAE